MPMPDVAGRVPMPMLGRAVVAMRAPVWVGVLKLAVSVKVALQRPVTRRLDRGHDGEG
jgi:hypothetical protein